MNEPVPMSQEELASILEDMAARVRAGDSYEGSIEYLMPLDEDVPDDTYAMMRASYRIGNLMGQGGVRIIGTMGGRPLRVGDRVRHQTDPHGRNEGVIIENARENRRTPLVKVRWNSGVEELVHPSELKLIEDVRPEP